MPLDYALIKDKCAPPWPCDPDHTPVWWSPDPYSTKFPGKKYCVPNPDIDDPKDPPIGLP